MSMLSSMTEKMRETADKVERFGHRNRDWLWRDATTITRAAVELRDAADTIDYLRNTCNDLQLENEKLKQLIRDYNRVPCLCDHNGLRCEYCDGDTCELYERGIALGALVAGVD